MSLALVSNVNGYMHNCKRDQRLWPTRTARYVFADIMQAVGAVPVDVKALGIDFASAGTYKWLMGERGFGFLYVREDLQGTVLPTTRYGHRQVTNFKRAALTWEPLPGAAKYETGASRCSLRAVLAHGTAIHRRSSASTNIRAHARQLTDRLQKELPAMGYPSLTPRGKRDADRGVRAEGRCGDASEIARRQRRRHHHRTRQAAAPGGVGVQQSTGHRRTAEGAGELITPIAEADQGLFMSW